MDTEPTRRQLEQQVVERCFAAIADAASTATAQQLRAALQEPDALAILAALIPELRPPSVPPGSENDRASSA